MKKIILAFLMGFAVFSARATHIVGGEFELSHLAANRYRLALIVYFDAVNGNPGALDQNVVVHIFSKANNRHVTTYNMPLQSNALVDYTNPDCGIGDLITRRLEYFMNIELLPENYTDPAGYYIVWERCCRNGTIDNIIEPGAAAQAFYMEFPPLIKNGQRFINSSPSLFPPLSDYACVDQPFYFDFAGTDADGDSLVYSLAVPLNGHSTPNEPRPLNPQAGPYETVDWRAGYGPENMIPGDPSLNIDKKGLVTVKPSQPGLYVFSVICEEYRDGSKIGTVVRDFQMLVINCTTGSPPEAHVLKPGSSETYNETDTLIFKIAEDKCMDIVVTDQDVGPIKGRIVEIEGISPGFLPVTSGNIGTPGAEIRLQACFPECPSPEGGAFAMYVIIKDDNCSLPMQDTVKIIAKIIPEPNTAPEVTAGLAFNTAEKTYTAEVIPGQPFSFDIFGNDKELDSLLLAAIGKDFDFAALGMQIGDAEGKAPLKTAFNWKVPCDLFDDGSEEKSYEFQLITTDKRKCGFQKSDTVTVILRVKKQDKINNIPKVLSQLNYDSTNQFYTDTIFFGEKSNFPVTATDLDKDSLALTLIPLGFDPADLSLSFGPTAGFAPLAADICWQSRCEDLAPDSLSKTLDFRIRVQDYDLCGRELSTDSVLYRLVLLPKPQNPPKILSQLNYDSTNRFYTDTIFLGEKFNFPVTATDLDGDSLVLSLNPFGFDSADLDLSFGPTNGFATVEAGFCWQSRCEDLSPDSLSKILDFRIRAEDYDPCGRQISADSALYRLVLLPNPQTPPSISTDLENSTSNGYKLDTVRVGDRIKFTVRGNDAENDSLLLNAEGLGFELADLGMDFKSVSGFPELTSEFEWTVSCETLDSLAFGKYSRELPVRFTATDYNACIAPESDTTGVKFILIFDPDTNTPPVLKALGINKSAEKLYADTLLAGQSVSFDLPGTDTDSDSISITAYGENFNLSDFGMQFSPVSGFAPLQTKFEWETDCEFLNASPEPVDFTVNFIIRDFNACGLSTADTIQTVFTVIPVANPNSPTLRTDLELKSNKIYGTIGRPNHLLNFPVYAEDLDKDVVAIRMEGLGFDAAAEGMVFPTTEGISPQTGNFSWTPNCEQLNRQKNWPVRFIVTDQTDCQLNKSDTILVEIDLEDFFRKPDFKPANVFTPNGDGKNDTFRIPNLPPDSCEDTFKEIIIYNRWGRQVFSSQSRDFSWTGKGFPDGAYFYHIIFKNTTYKNTVTLLGGGS